jgi:hypothetical protein
MPRETEPVFFRLDANLKAKLEQAAQDEDLTLAQLLRRIIREWLAAREQKPQQP